MDYLKGLGRLDHDGIDEIAAHHNTTWEQVMKDMVDAGWTQGIRDFEGGTANFEYWEKEER